jgi:hypothetical protein
MQQWKLAKRRVSGTGICIYLRAPRAAEGSNPRRLCIPEEVGYRLQEGVPPCKSGMAQEEHRHE